MSLPAYQRRLLANLSSPRPSPVMTSVSKKETNRVPKNPSPPQQLQCKSNTKHVQRTPTLSKPEKNVHKSSHSESLMKRRSIFEKPKSKKTENDYDTWKRNRLKNENKTNQKKSQHNWKPARLNRQNAVLNLFQNRTEKNNIKCATSKIVAANKAEEIRKMKEAMKKRELLFNDTNSLSPCETIDKQSIPALSEQDSSQWKNYSIVVNKNKKINSRNNSLSSISSSTSVSSHQSFSSYTSTRKEKNLKLPNDTNVDSTPFSTPKQTIRRLSFETKKMRCSTAEKVASERAEELRKMREAIAKREKMLEQNNSKPRKSITNATGEIIANNKAAEMREMREAMKKRELALEEASQHSSPIVDNLDAEPKLLQTGNNQWLKHVIILNESKTKYRDTSDKGKNHGKSIKSNIKKNEAEGMKNKEENQFEEITLKKEKHQKPRKVSNKDPEPMPFHKITNLQITKRSRNVCDEPKKHPILSRISYEFDENEDPICSTARKIAADKAEEMRKMKDALSKREMILEHENLQRRQDSQKTPLFERCSTARLVAAHREEEMRNMREVLRKREIAVEKMSQPKYNCSSTIDQHEPDLSFEESNSQWKKHVLCINSTVKDDQTKKNIKKNIISQKDIKCDRQMTAEEKRLAKYVPF